MESDELIRLVERELADGNPAARETAWRAHRELFERRDAEGLERLLALAAGIEGSGNLVNTIQHDLKWLSTRPPGQRDHSPVKFARTLGVVAAALAFLISIGVIFVGGVFIGLACQGCSSSDGDWLLYSLLVTFVVAMAGLVGALSFDEESRWFVGAEGAAAAGMVVAIVCLAVDGGDMHLDGDRVNASFLYVVYALIAILFMSGAAVALYARRHGRESA